MSRPGLLTAAANVSCVLSATALAAGALSGDVTQANIHEMICVPGDTKTVRPWEWRRAKRGD